MNCIKNDSRVLIKKIYTSKILHLAFKMFEQKKHVTSLFIAK